MLESGLPESRAPHGSMQLPLHCRHRDSLEELDAFTDGGGGDQRSKASVWRAVGTMTCRDSLGRQGARLKHGTGLKGGCGRPSSGLQRGISLMISGGKATHPADFGEPPRASRFGSRDFIPRDTVGDPTPRAVQSEPSPVHMDD